MTLPLRNLAAIMVMLAYLCAGFLMVLPQHAAAVPAQAAAHAMEHGHAPDHGHAVETGHGQHGAGQNHQGHPGDAPGQVPDCAQDCAQGKSCALCHGAVAAVTMLSVFDGAPAFAAAARRSHVSITQQLPDEPPSL